MGLNLVFTKTKWVSVEIFVERKRGKGRRHR